MCRGVRICLGASGCVCVCFSVYLVYLRLCDCVLALFKVCFGVFVRVCVMLFSVCFRYVLGVLGMFARVYVHLTFSCVCLYVGVFGYVCERVVGVFAVLSVNVSLAERLRFSVF